MNKLPPKLLLVLLLTLAFSMPYAQAEESSPNWYTVEVISFSRNKSNQIEEKWLEGRQQLFMQLPDQTDSELVKAVSENQWQLSRHAYSLGRSPELKLQSHQAWRQPGLSRQQAPWVKLNSESQGFTGQVRISLSRYLHAEVDIQLRNPDWTFAENQPFQQHARTVSFKASRRMKRDEIHYIDHPLAGVIIKIERFEPEKSQ